jgi:hypothetical protein
MQKILRRLGPKIALVLALALSLFGATVFTARPADAAPSTHCWHYVGGSTVSGGCVGSPYGGSDVQVIAVCKMWGVTEQSWVYAPPNRAVSTTTPGCPWWTGGAVQGIVNSF